MVLRTHEREFGVLMSVPDQYDKLVLSMDGFGFSADGIRRQFMQRCNANHPLAVSSKPPYRHTPTIRRRFRRNRPTDTPTIPDYP